HVVVRSKAEVVRHGSDAMRPHAIGDVAIVALVQRVPVSALDEHVDWRRACRRGKDVYSLKRRFAHSDVEGARIVSARRFTPPGPACEMLFVVREACPIVVLGIELRLGKAVVDAFAAHALRLLPCLGATAPTFCRSP